MSMADTLTETEILPVRKCKGYDKRWAKVNLEIYQYLRIDYYQDQNFSVPNLIDCQKIGEWEKKENHHADGRLCWCIAKL